MYQLIEAQHEQMRSDPISTSPLLIVALSATAALVDRPGDVTAPRIAEFLVFVVVGERTRAD